MKQYAHFIVASSLSLALGVGIAAMTYYKKRNFDRMVMESLKTSEGYDRQYVSMVHHLEQVMTSRASFGYIGGKDPMTGKIRSVVKPVRVATKPAPRKPAAEKGDAAKPDPCKLTAIISGNDGKKHTAIIMIDERSFAVEAGDRIADRKIIQVTSDMVIIENDTMQYMYTVSGETRQRRK